MSAYQIITDSSCDFTLAQYAELDLQFASLKVLYKGENHNSFTEPAELRAFYDGIRGGEMPTTSAVNPEDWKAIMEPIVEAGQDVLCLAFSSGLSTTYQSAVIAAEELKESHPDRKIHVVDTLCAALGQGLLVWYACHKRKAGMSLDELTEWVEENKLKLCHEVTVDDLNHLKRGGRVSATTAIVGTMLSIKPMIRMDNNGKLETIGKVRGRKGAMEQIVKRFGELTRGCENETIFIAHGDCEEDAVQLGKMIQAKHPNVKNIRIGYVGGTIGAHTGPGVLVAFFMGNNR